MIAFGRNLLEAGVLATIILLSGPVLAQQNGTMTRKPENVEQRRIITLLQKERQNLKQRTAKLDAKQKELKILQTEVEKKFAQMQKVKQSLNGLLQQKKGIEKQRLADLSSIYQRMDPARAAAALVTMDQQLAIGILSQMRSKNAGAILNQMPKDKTAELSQAFTRLQSTSSPP